MLWGLADALDSGALIKKGKVGAHGTQPTTLSSLASRPHAIGAPSTGLVNSKEDAVPVMMRQHSVGSHESLDPNNDKVCSSQQRTVDLWGIC